MTDLKYWLWLTLALRQSSRKLASALEYFETPLDIYRAKEQDFRKVNLLTRKDAAALCDKSLSAAENIMTECRKKGIHILTLDNPHYPRLLANIFDPPCVLYVKCRERIDLNSALSVAMVGTRKMSAYGRAAAIELAGDLARAGVTVVSGMARGIDGAAHTGALRAGGKTVAVLGCGVDVVYPPEHGEMMKQIIQSGMVISEYPPGSRPLPNHFPTRNRIISGLSAGTVVVESPEAGGSLITASLALEQGRDVFAVPGDINRPLSDGTNELIRQGAHLVSSALDIISEYREEYVSVFENVLHAEQENPQATGSSEMPAVQNETDDPLPALPTLDNEAYQSLPPEEKAIVDCLSLTPSHVDTLAEKTGLPVQQLNASLTLLEMKGMISQLAGRHFVLKL